MEPEQVPSSPLSAPSIPSPPSPSPIPQVSLCLDTLGKVPWPAASRAEVWAAVLAKVPELGASGGR